MNAKGDNAPTRDATGKQWVTFKCCAARAIGQYLAHYDICRCGQCGRSFWALQPQRGGPLVGFRWPGNSHTGAMPT